MNKQDKIKKVMREFKDGKLKTPNGEVVTDKKQALAIAMSESEDYAEKADLIEDIFISSLSHAEDVIKSIGSEELLEKAVYANTSENRKLGRVGQEYHRGKGKKEEKKVSGGKNSARFTDAVKDEVITQRYPRDEEHKILRKALAALIKELGMEGREQFKEFMEYNEFVNSVSIK